MLAAPQARTRCPGQAELQDFWLGRLPSSLSDSLADHVSECPRCAQALAEVRHHKDAVVAHLQQCRRDPDDSLSPDYSRLEELARAMIHGAVIDPSAATTPSSRSPRALSYSRLGGYQLLNVIGRGGMGDVYKARQLSLNRLVAVKIIQAGTDARSDELQRFRNEGNALALVQHRNVVQIYELSEDQGRLYYSMELIDGGTLAARLEQGRLPAREAAVLVHQLAEGVQAAHSKGVIHRDLKPANVLMTKQGLPKIADFGLARLLDGLTSLTGSGIAMGTPCYMAPEQTVDAGSAEEPADIYSLGAILYECLTRQPPFRSDSREQTMRAVRLNRPLRPSALVVGIDRQLESICLKCLHKEPEDRYRSATELAADLDHWLRGERISIHPAVVSSSRLVGLGMLTGVLLVLALLSWSELSGEASAPQPPGPLATGQPLTLIDDKGKLHCKTRWVTGKDESNAATTPQGAFRVHSWSVALLELSAANLPPRFTLEGEISHEESDWHGGVGLFGALQEHRHPNSWAVHCLCLVYDDVRSERERHLIIRQNIPNPNLLPIPKGNWAAFHSRFLGVNGNQRGEDMRLSQMISDFFEPTPRTWRRLKLHVSPGEVRAEWEGKPVGPLTAERIVADSDRTRKGFQISAPITGAWMPPIPHHAAQGGVGLYVQRGSASFRNFVVRPIKEAE